MKSETQNIPLQSVEAWAHRIRTEMIETGRVRDFLDLKKPALSATLLHKDMALFQVDGKPYIVCQQPLAADRDNPERAAYMVYDARTQTMLGTASDLLPALSKKFRQEEKDWKVLEQNRKDSLDFFNRFAKAGDHLMGVFNSMVTAHDLSDRITHARALLNQRANPNLTTLVIG